MKKQKQDQNLYVKNDDLIFIKDIDLPKSAIFDGINNGSLILYVSERYNLKNNELYYLRLVPVPITVKTEYILDDIHKYLITANDGKSYEIIVNDLLLDKYNDCSEILCFKKENYATFKEQALEDIRKSTELKIEITKVANKKLNIYEKIIFPMIICFEENNLNKFNDMRREFVSIMEAESTKEKDIKSLHFCDVRFETLQDTFKEIKKKATSLA